MRPAAESATQSGGDGPVPTHNDQQVGRQNALVDILVAVILLLTSLCYLRIQTLFAWILNSSFHVLTATSMRIDVPEQRWAQELVSVAFQIAECVVIGKKI